MGTLSPDYDELFVQSSTCVFWDMEDFPIIDHSWVGSFRENITRALEIEGYINTDPVNIGATGPVNTPKRLKRLIRRHNINLELTNAEKRERLEIMLWDMMHYALSVPRWEGQVSADNLLVIAKDTPEKDSQFSIVVKGLMANKFNVFLVVPDDCTPESLPCATLVWRWKDLLRGEMALRVVDKDKRIMDLDEDKSNMDVDEDKSIMDAGETKSNMDDDEDKSFMDAGETTSNIDADETKSNMDPDYPVNKKVKKC